MLSVACLSVASCIELILIWGLASPHGPIERAKLIPTKRVHLDKWEGNDTSGARPSSFLSAIFFQWFQVPAGLGLSFSLMSASCYDAATGEKNPHFPKASRQLTKWTEIPHIQGDTTSI